MNAVIHQQPQDLRPAPASVESERYVIGSILVKPETMALVADWLSASDFSMESHRLIWQTAESLLASGKAVDAIVVAEAIDGVSFDEIIDIAQGAVSTANIVAHAEIVLEKSRLRLLADLGTRIAGAALRGDKGSADIAADMTHALSGLQVESRGGPQPIKPVLKRFYQDLMRRYESGDRMHGRATPWQQINDLTHGLKPGELVIVGARPGMGKSVMGFRLASFDSLRPEGRALLFSLEMTAEEFAQREVSAIGDVPHSWVRAPDQDIEKAHLWTRVTEAMSRMMGSGILIDDSPALTVAQIAARARRAHLQAPLSMVVVDHLHIVRIKGDNPVREMGDVSRALKALAKELNVPVVALAQLNRGNTQRADKRPTMADLRGSGEIEQDADYIFLLHRPDYYDEDDDTGVVEVIVGKGRNVRGKTITLKNRLDVMRFDDWGGPLPERKEKTRGGHRGFDA